MQTIDEDMQVSMYEKWATPFIYKLKDWVKWASKQSQKPNTALWGVCDAIKVSLQCEEQPVSRLTGTICTHGGSSILLASE
jgi:hypothetical protein